MSDWCLHFNCDYNLDHFEDIYTNQETGLYLWYSSGLDSTGVPNCMLLHEQTWTDDNINKSALNLSLFDQEGNFIKHVYESDLNVWPQCVKLIRDPSCSGVEDKIWFSYTNTPQSSGAGFYTIPWDETLQIYPVSSPTAEIPDIPYNWKVTQRKTDGKIFFCAAGTSSFDFHSIYYYNETSGSITKVVEIGGYSCGFDFDSEGNLWSGEYLLSYEGGMHIVPCRLGMWRKEDVDAVIAGQRGFLTWDDAVVVIPLGTYPNTNFNWGVSDVACDDRGNVYVSMNTYEPGHFDSNHEYGAVIKVYKDEEGNYQKEYLLLRDNTGNNNWDWFRSMTIDNNNLILDIDHNQKDPNSPDVCQVIQI